MVLGLISGSIRATHLASDEGSPVIDSRWFCISLSLSACVLREVSGGVMVGRDSMRRRELSVGQSQR